MKLHCCSQIRSQRNYLDSHIIHFITDSTPSVSHKNRNLLKPWEKIHIIYLSF